MIYLLSLSFDFDLQFLQILKLAAVRIRNLCERVQHVELTERVYNVFNQILDQQTTLFFNRHIDQLILCCLYGVAKVSFTLFNELPVIISLLSRLADQCLLWQACKVELSFKELLNYYRKEAQCKPEVFQNIYLGSRNRNDVCTLASILHLYSDSSFFILRVLLIACFSESYLLSTGISITPCWYH